MDSAGNDICTANRITKWRTSRRHAFVGNHARPHRYFVRKSTVGSAPSENRVFPGSRHGLRSCAWKRLALLTLHPAGSPTQIYNGPGQGFLVGLFSQFLSSSRVSVQSIALSPRGITCAHVMSIPVVLPSSLVLLEHTQCKVVR